jgi:hypothetical protein
MTLADILYHGASSRYPQIPIHGHCKISTTSMNITTMAMYLSVDLGTAEIQAGLWQGRLVATKVVKNGRESLE